MGTGPPTRTRQTPNLVQMHQLQAVIDPFLRGNTEMRLDDGPAFAPMAPMAARPLDPSAPLSIEKAARLADVSEDELRGRIEAGELLHESSRGRSSSRNGGEGDVLVRAVDLAALYPKVRLKSAGVPVMRAKPQVGRTRTTATAAESSDRDVLPTPAAPASAAPARTEITDALASRLDAIETANGDLRTQLVDLRSQRQDLVSQCDDLRGRLDRAERERQASTAGLMLAQKRLHELEAPVVTLPPPWRRRTTYGLGVVVVLLAFFLRQQVVQASALSEHVTGLSGDVQERDAQIEELGEQLPGLTRALAELDGQLARTRTEADRERSALLETLEQQRLERSAAEAKSQQELERLAQEQRLARTTLQAERDALAADQQRWASEREAEVRTLAQRESEMQALVEQCMAAVETLANAPVPRAATGFVGRIVERLEGPDPAPRVSQDAPIDG
mgnify:FL=1